VKTKALVLLLLAVAVALAAAGCGGGKSRSNAYAGSTTAYAAAISSICGPADQQFKSLGLNTLSDIESKGSQAVDILNKAAGKIDSLQPPDSVKSAANDLVSTVKQEATKINDLVSAIKSKDQTKIQQLEIDLRSLGSKAKSDSSTIGATVCSG
jgi:hypothetical protein